METREREALEIVGGVLFLLLLLLMAGCKGTNLFVKNGTGRAVTEVKTGICAARGDVRKAEPFVSVEGKPWIQSAIDHLDMSEAATGRAFDSITIEQKGAEKVAEERDKWKGKYERMYASMPMRVWRKIKLVIALWVGWGLAAVAMSVLGGGVVRVVGREMLSFTLFSNPFSWLRDAIVKRRAT